MKSLTKLNRNIKLYHVKLIILSFKVKFGTRPIVYRKSMYQFVLSHIIDAFTILMYLKLFKGRYTSYERRQQIIFLEKIILFIFP